MSRSERNAHFERLVALRLRPAEEADRRSVISIDAVIAYAEAVMRATQLELAAAERPATPDGRKPSPRRFDGIGSSGSAPNVGQG